MQRFTAVTIVSIILDMTRKHKAVCRMPPFIDKCIWPKFYYGCQIQYEQVQHESKRNSPFLKKKNKSLVRMSLFPYLFLGQSWEREERQPTSERQESSWAFNLYWKKASPSQQLSSIISITGVSRTLWSKAGVVTAKHCTQTQMHMKGKILFWRTLNVYQSKR